MASSLPRITGAGGSPYPSAPTSLSGNQQQKEDINAPHPFDTPFTLMKSMKAEIADLRNELWQEQKRHDAQVEALKQDLQDLRNTLLKEQSDRTASCENLGSMLASETARRESEQKVFKEATEDALNKKALVVDLRALEDKVAQIDAEVKSEGIEWRNSTDENHTQIQMNTRGDNEFAKSVRKQLAEHKKALDDNAENDAEFANHIMPRVQMAGQLLLTAGDWNSPTKVTIPSDATVAELIRISEHAESPASDWNSPTKATIPSDATFVIRISEHAESPAAKPRTN